MLGGAGDRDRTGIANGPIYVANNSESATSGEILRLN